MTELAISMQGLAKHFKGTVALDGVDLDVPAGQVFGLLGPNGAGKTTTIQVLLGLLPATRGSAQVFGMDTARQGALIRSRVGALLEHHGLYERFSAERNLEFYARIHGLSLGERRLRIRAALDGIGLWSRRNDLVGTWSKGMKQKLAIARALLHAPPLVFLDEPTAGHDPASAKDLRDQLAQIVKTQGTTIFLTTHNLSEAEALCRQIAILQRGRVAARGAPAELRARASTPRLVMETGPVPAAVLGRLRKQKHVADVRQVGRRLEIDSAVLIPAAPLVKLLVAAGVDVEEVTRKHASMEEAYIQLTREEPA